MVKSDIAAYWPKKRNAAAENAGNSVDSEALDEPCIEKALNGDPAVNVEMLRAALAQPGDDLVRRTGHVLHAGSGWRRQSARLTGQHNNRLLAVRPPPEGQNLLERMPPNDERVHGRHECPVPVVFPVRQLSVGRQPVEFSVLPSDIAVQTGGDENGRPHVHPRLSCHRTSQSSAASAAERSESAENAVLGGDDFIKAFYDAEKFFRRGSADSLAEALNGKRANLADLHPRPLRKSAAQQLDG